MKKITTIIMTAIIALSVFAGCSSKNADNKTPENTKAVTLEEIHTAVKEAYGENYLPNAEIPGELLEGEFGLTEDLYEEVLAEQPMIGVHADRVVLVKAKEGKADAVEEALNTAKEKKIADTMQYPMNLAKISAAKIVRHGDFVAFLLVGAVNEDMEATEEEAKTFAESEVEKAVEAVNRLFE